MEISYKQNVISGRLPYTSEIEYLETDGNSYIDLGIPPDPDGSFSITFSYDMKSINAAIFGTGYYGGWTISYLNENSGFWSYIGTSAAVSCKTKSIDEIVKFEIKNKIGGYVNDKLTVNWYNQFSDITVNDTCCLFYQKPHSGKTSREMKSGVKIYQVQLKACGFELDLIPVRVGYDGYMYDKISGKLFRNDGTGNFILGPDVKPSKGTK